MKSPVVFSPWPNYKTLLALRGTRRTNVGRQLRLGFVMLSTHAQRRRVEPEFGGEDATTSFFARERRFFEPLYFQYVNTQCGVRERFALASQDLLRVKAYVAAHGEVEVRLFEAEDWSVGFGINRICKEEGYWALTLRNALQQSVYSLSVACSAEGDLLVGSVQGCEVSVADPKEAIRLMTKQMEGLRPPHFLLEVLKAWCRAMGRDLAGVSAACQVKAHHRSGASAQVFFDYDAFWQECGATKSELGYWAIPTSRTERDLSAEPSKKRAMYRRREALLDDLGEAITVAAARLQPFAQASRARGHRRAG